MQQVGKVRNANGGNHFSIFLNNRRQQQPTVVVVIQIARAVVIDI